MIKSGFECICLKIGSKNKPFIKERVREEKGFLLSILIQSENSDKTQIQAGITFNVNIEMGLRILKYNKTFKFSF